MRSPDSSLTVLAVLAGFAAAMMFAATTATVDTGDTLSGIAADYGVSIDDLVAWNNIDDPDEIFSGDVLVVSDPSAPARRHESTTHVVTPGETLSLIAARYGASVAALVEANHLVDPDRIRAGAVLVLEPAATPAVATDSTSASGPRHAVLPGDTLWSIASSSGVSVADLVAWNALNDENQIVSGQFLLLSAPDGAAPSSPAEPSPASTTPPPTTTSTPPAPTTADPVTPRPSVTQTPLADAFSRWASSYGVPQDLLEAIAWQASDWQPAITGPDGRLGIGQLTPAAVDLVETRLLGLELDPLATSDGVRLAARYLRYLIDRTNSDRDALIAWRVGLSEFLDGASSPAAEEWADAVLEIRRMRG